MPGHLLSFGPHAPNGHQAKKLRVVTYIRTTFTRINEALSSQPHDEVKVSLQRVTRSQGRKIIDSTRSHNHSEDLHCDQVKEITKQVTYTWPGSTAEEAWRFACLLAILNEIDIAIQSNITVTKRDIYYRHPELLRKQDTVDRFIDDIAFTCGVSRKDLRVTASPKGLVSGLHLNSNALLGSPPSERVQLVPSDPETIAHTHVEHLRWILVVEKEASFKELVEKNFDTRTCLGPGLLVTAKGYPDLSSRLFLRHILDLPTPTPIPIFSLVDCDPDGLDIHRCYSSSTRVAAQESSVALPEIKWLGVDVTECLGNKGVLDKCLALTKRDRGRARGMLNRTVENSEGSLVNSAVSHDAEVGRVKKCLQTMLMLGVKMEIQAIDETVVESGLCGWLERKMVVARGY